MTAALYLARIGHEEESALRSLAQVIAAPGKSMAKGRAWANVFLLGAQAKGIEEMFQAMRLAKHDQATRTLLRSRLHDH